MPSTAPNTANNDALSFDMDYCCRSIAFGAREFVFNSAKSNGVVCRNVIWTLQAWNETIIVVYF
jgi:hypothetical protein